MVRWFGHLVFFVACVGAVVGALTASPAGKEGEPRGPAVPTGVTDQAGVSPPMPVYLFGEKWREISAEQKGGRPLFVVARSFVYCYRPTGEVFTVPAGYVTDFASIPSALRDLIAPDGPWAPAAIMHDYLYAVGEPAGRQIADSVFHAMMMDMGVDPRRAAVLYYGVRYGGSEGYNLPNDWMWADLDRFEPGVGPPKPRSAASRTASGKCADQTGRL